MKTKYQIIILGLVTLLSRIPFLGAGYGSDPDAWRLADAARKIIDTGQYTLSREPCHPVQEYITALFIGGGPWLVNGLTALMSVAAVVFFALVLMKWGLKNYLPAAMALAFVPVVYINSVNAMDYIWALGFIMVGLYFLSDRKYWLTGLMIGLAIGSRVTSGVFLIPFALIILTNDNLKTMSDKIRPIIIMVGVALLTGIIIYIPVYLRYGFDFWMFYEGAPTGFRDVMNLATYGVWGFTGVLGIGLLLILLSFFPGILCRTGKEINGQQLKLIRPLLIGIGIILVGFVRLPAESGYLIPIIPFILILMVIFFKRHAVIAFCLIMFLSSFITITINGHSLDFDYGPVLTDHTSRVKGHAFVENIFAAEAEMADKSVVITAWWEPYLRIMHHPNPTKDIRYVYHVDRTRLDDWLSKGYTIYHLSYVEAYNLENYGVDLTQVSQRLNVEY